MRGSRVAALAAALVLLVSIVQLPAAALDDSLSEGKHQSQI
jgi:hypothetical protein